MKLTVGLKLKPTSQQAAALRQTLHRANAAANQCAGLAWAEQTFAQFKLHRLAYRRLREQYSLSAQLVVRVIAKVAAAYQLDRRKQRAFRPAGSIPYDDRILRYGEDYVTIWTVDGRQKIPFVCGARERRLLAARKGESDLVLRQGKWYLYATIEVSEPPLNPAPQGFLAIDFGIARIASEHNGKSHSGAHIRNLRKRHRRLRQKLQSKGTRSAKRLLKKRGGKERLFAKDVNHQISKKIVRKAQRTKRVIVLEDLKYIRTRVRAQRRLRAELHSWSFGQLRSFIEYKAKRVGVAVIAIDPRNTSRECSQCGHICAANRRSQSRFQCRQCGAIRHADINAALNIRRRAAINQPNAT